MQVAPPAGELRDAGAWKRRISVRMIASLWSTPIFSPLNILDHSSRTRMRPARYRMERGSHLTRESKHV
jgi:hypothetical protein